MRRLARTVFFLLLLSILGSGLARADTRAEARRYFQQGMALIDQGKFTEGIDLLKKAYAIRPHPSVLFNIARAYAAAGLIDPAIEHFERYLATDPADAENVDKELKELKARRRLRGLVDEGMQAIDQGRYTEGIALLKRAYDARPHPNILFNIARAYEDARDYRHAIQTYERYLKSSPKDEEEVAGRLKRLRALDKPKPVTKPARRPEIAVKEPERETKREKEKDKDRERDREREKERDFERTERAIGAGELDEAQMERLAQLIAQQLRRDQEDRGEVASIGKETGEQPAPKTEEEVAREKRHETAVVEISKSSTAGVTLEAKGGEAYEEVVVTASRRAQSPLDAPNAVTVITDEDIRLSGAHTVPDLLRRVPGMDVIAMSYSDFNVAMRGFNRRLANKILVLIDGRTVYEDFLGVMLWRMMTIDLADIARIEVVRGPGSAVYGAYAYTGMVNIITKRPEDLHGSLARVSGANGSTLEAVYQYGERRGPFGVRASVGYERANKYEVEFDPKRVDYTPSASNPDLSMEQARFDVTTEYNFKGGGGRLYASGGARSGFDELYGVANLRDQNVTGQIFNVRGGYESDLFSLVGFWNGLRVQTTPAYFATGENPLGSNVHADLIAVEPVFRPSFTLGGEHALVLGGEYRHKYIDWVPYIDQAHNEDFFAVFAQDQWAPASWFTAIASGRLDLHPLIGPLASPRLAVIFKPTPRQALRASVGTAFRQPTQSETYLNLTALSPVAGVAVKLVGGHESLKPENIETIDVGYLIQPDFGEFEAVVYLNRISNLIQRSALTLIPGATFDPNVGAFPSFISNYYNDPAHYLAFGSELSVRLFPVEGVDLGANYAFQYIYNQETGDRFTDSPIHKLNLWAQLRTRLGIDIAASAHLVSNQKWHEPDYDPSTPSGFRSPALPLPPSVVVIGRVGYRLLEDKLELAVSGVNLTDWGADRHREHPYANRVEARVYGTVTARF